MKSETAGVSVICREFKDCRHGFTHSGFNEYMPEQADKAWNLMAEFIRSTVSEH